MADKIDHHAKTKTGDQQQQPLTSLLAVASTAATLPATVALQSTSFHDYTDTELVSMQKNMQVLHHMICFSNERLTGLRTACATNDKLVQDELGCLENKFVRMFAEMMRLRSRLPDYLCQELSPRAMLHDWLLAVGLCTTTMHVVMRHINSVDALLSKNEDEIDVIMQNSPRYRDVECQRLRVSSRHLRMYRKSLEKGERLAKTDLRWNSWDPHDNALHTKVTAASPGSPRAIRKKPTKLKPKLAKPLPPAPPPLPLPTTGTPAQSPPPPTPSAPPVVDNAAEEPPSALTNNNTRQTISPENTCINRLTPSPSPPSSPSTSSSAFSANNSTIAIKPTAGRVATPPPQRKHMTNVHTLKNTSTSAVVDQALTKSKSHESQLLAALAAAHSLANFNQIDHQPHAGRSRLFTEPSPDHANDLSSTFDHNTLHVPRTPGTPGGTSTNLLLAHKNPVGAPNPDDSDYQAPLHGHRFNKKFKLIATCDQCGKQMFFGLKCKECKYRCHKDCEPLVESPCCGVPGTPNAIGGGGSSPLMANNRHTSIGGGGVGIGSYLTGRKDRKRSQDYSAGSTESSCNSSTPSSPALQQVVTPLQSAAKFKFPDVQQQQHTNIYKPPVAGNLTLEAHLMRLDQKHAQLPAAAPTSPRTKQRTTSPPEVVVVGANNQPVASHGPPSNKDAALLHDNSLEATDNTQSEDSSSKDSPRSAIRVDSTEDPDDGQWTRQNSVSLKEWDIPFEDIVLVEKIGDGRFGTVHRALWHGAVAVRVLKQDYQDTEAFRIEVATFKKTRHENVVLFMGACMNPQAIVTALCKGNTLYTHLHVRKDKFNMSRTTMIAHQIARGMGYLHDRNITHKDLKSKNVFIENGRVIITDFALFSATKLEYHERMGLCIPKGWLPYLAPEIMQRLTPTPPVNRDQLPFSFKSDVFAFGTIWYELLAQHLPYEDQCVESTIFKVGRGMKPPLTNIITTREVKEIMIKCWAYDVDTRPNFAFVCRQLDSLPKKRLARSPSHPVQLSRSAESVF